MQFEMPINIPAAAAFAESGDREDARQVAFVVIKRKGCIKMCFAKTEGEAMMRLPEHVKREGGAERAICNG